MRFGNWKKILWASLGAGLTALLEALRIQIGG